MIAFNNKPNTFYKTTCGRKIWHNRACAVACSILAVPLNNPEDMHALLVKRGPSVDLAPSKYCVPSGYIDWDEDGSQAIIREVYEESGIYIPNLLNDDSLFIEYDGVSEGFPWFVNTDPNANRQDIVLHYGMFFYTKEFFPKTSISYNETEGEIELVEWLPVSDLHRRDIAFGHDQKIYQFMDFLTKKGNIIINLNKKE